MCWEAHDVEDTPTVLDINELAVRAFYGRTMDEEAIDVHELARRLAISEWKAYDLAADPLFPSFRVGNRHRFWRSEVLAYLAQPRDPWKQSTRSRARRRTGRSQPSASGRPRPTQLPPPPA